MIGRGTAIADIHLPIQLGGDQALFHLWNRWLLERERQVPGVLLGGHIGRDGAGLSPIRGHSNVQGDRTMGIFDRHEPDLLDALEAEFGVAMPRPLGSTPSMTARAARSSSRSRIRWAWFMRPVVSSSHRRRRELAWLVPSRCRSEATNICELATAIFGRDHRVSWGAMRTNNDIVRDHIARVIPGFNDFNTRVRKPAGFALPHPSRDERRNGPLQRDLGGE